MECLLSTCSCSIFLGFSVLVSFLQLPIVGCWFLMSGVSVGGSGLFLVVKVSLVECCM